MGKETKAIPVFDGTRFRGWSSRMISSLVDKDLDLVVGIDPTKRKLNAAAPTLSADGNSGLTKRTDIKARAKILAHLSSEVQALIGAETAEFAYDLWKRLTQQYSRSSSAATVAAVKKCLEQNSGRIRSRRTWRKSKALPRMYLKLQASYYQTG